MCRPMAANDAAEADAYLRFSNTLYWCAFGVMSWMFASNGGLVEIDSSRLGGRDEERASYQSVFTPLAVDALDEGQVAELYLRFTRPRRGILRLRLYSS